ncbi:hypothetical protein [Algoriphagus sp.]|uniref:hypothetical protein n=1 Tax=Algoriphagus sp. TaxID=1872435 RepID=UPI003277A88D
MTRQKTPFVYRSFFNFWLAIILPASIIFTLVFQLIKGESNWSEYFMLPSTYIKVLIFQLVFGAWMYYKEYKPKSANYEKDA